MAPAVRLRERLPEEAGRAGGDAEAHEPGYEGDDADDCRRLADRRRGDEPRRQEPVDVPEEVGDYAGYVEPEAPPDHAV